MSSMGDISASMLDSFSRTWGRLVAQPWGHVRAMLWLAHNTQPQHWILPAHAISCRTKGGPKRPHLFQPRHDGPDVLEVLHFARQAEGGVTDVAAGRGGGRVGEWGVGGWRGWGVGGEQVAVHGHDHSPTRKVLLRACMLATAAAARPAHLSKVLRSSEHWRCRFWANCAFQEAASLRRLFLRGAVSRDREPAMGLEYSA